MARSPDQVHREVCAVLYRIQDQRVEFCLVSTERTSRWELPHTEIADRESSLEAAYRCVLEQTGLVCHTGQQEPLDDVMATQNRRLVQVVAYLLEAQPGGNGAPHRIRWCLAEEARARIRRKPMRRLIDLAIRRQADQAGH
jgi:ADP-ribose pyrophosphatase YjhB (NUDIX family)